MIRIQGAPSFSVRKIRLSVEKEEEITKWIEEELEKAIGYREGQMPKWKAWIKQANSRRERKDAGPRDSKVDLGITAEYKQALKARLLNAIFQHDQVFTAVPRWPMYEDSARTYEMLLDQFVDRTEFSLMADEWLDYGLTLPIGVVKTHWIDEQQRVKRWSEFQEGMEGSEDLSVVEHRGRTFYEEWTEIPSRQGCFPEVVPTEDFFYPPGTRDVESATWIAHRVWLNHSEVKARVRQGLWRDSINGKPILERLGEPCSERERLLKTTDEDMEEGELFEVFEIYTEYEIKKNDPVECIFYYVRGKENLIVQALYNPYHEFPRPFVTWSYRNVPCSIEGIPLTYVLEPIHVAYSACVNQRLDAASRANTVKLFVRQGSDTKKAWEENVDDIVVEVVDDPKDINPVFISQPWTQLPELEEKLLSHADKLIGISDYLRGNEQVERPTASGQVQLIDEAKQQLYMLLENFRRKFAIIAKHMLARYKQFFPAGLEQYINASGEGYDPTTLLQFPEESINDSVIVETKVSSASMSKQLRKQEVVALVDKLPEIYNTMMGLAQAAVNPSPISPVASKILMGFQVAMDKFFTEFEISKKEFLNPNLMGDIQHGQYMAQMQQQMQAMAQQIQQMGSQLQGQRGGPPPGPPQQGGGPTPMGGTPGPQQGGGRGAY